MVFRHRKWLIDWMLISVTYTVVVATCGLGFICGPNTQCIGWHHSNCSTINEEKLKRNCNFHTLVFLGFAASPNHASPDRIICLFPLRLQEPVRWIQCTNENSLNVSFFYSCATGLHQSNRCRQLWVFFKIRLEWETLATMTVEIHHNRSWKMPLGF